MKDKPVHQWGIFEAEVATIGRYENPPRDLIIDVEFAGPAEKRGNAIAFWDGGRRWKARFSPPTPGSWRYRWRCSNPGETGIHARVGNFECLPYEGRNELFRHGPLKTADSGRNFVHADGTPFFWLSDTAWNAAMKSDLKDFVRYLKDRRKKGFTAVQFVITNWFVADRDPDGRRAYSGDDPILIEPLFFRRMDRFVQAANDNGLVAVLAPLWAPCWPAPDVQKLNPGAGLPEYQQIALAQYVRARYGEYNVAWFLSGDAPCQGESAEKWKRIGRAVFGRHPNRPVTLHPDSWPDTGLKGEDWYTFVGYQSGHGGAESDHRWLCEGPPASEWRTGASKPTINIEPCYEGHMAMSSGGKAVHDAFAVRRACYWSLLASPTAGVSYGAAGVWGWHARHELPLYHENTGIAAPWFVAATFPGSQQMGHIKSLFSSLDWWRLVPDPELVADQPGRADILSFISAARSEAGDLAVVYIPVGGKVSLNTARLAEPAQAEWFNPMTGSRHAAGRIANTGVQTVDAPGPSHDWVLILK